MERRIKTEGEASGIFKQEKIHLGRYISYEVLMYAESFLKEAVDAVNPIAEAVIKKYGYGLDAGKGMTLRTAIKQEAVNYAWKVLSGMGEAWRSGIIKETMIDAYSELMAGFALSCLEGITDNLIRAAASMQEDLIGYLQDNKDGGEKEEFEECLLTHMDGENITPETTFEEIYKAVAEYCANVLEYYARNGI